MMDKEFYWDIDGHRVCCVYTGNKYVIYLDDDHVTNIYRRSGGAMRRGLEAPVELFGKPCLFTVWDETPDLVVDGIMVTKGVSYETAKAKRKQANQLLYAIMAAVGAVLLAIGVVLVYLFGSMWSGLITIAAVTAIWGGMSWCKWGKW